jgi:murein DD-endopeptidase MepM/ murein hydrolase activator NlpD
MLRRLPRNLGGIVFQTVPRLGISCRIPADRKRDRFRRPRVPTRVKVGAALAIVSAVAAGVAGGSRLPALLPDSGGTAVAARGVGADGGRISGGTPRALTDGPFHPVVGRFDYGAADARFGVWRGDHRHEGQDVFATTGTPLVAVVDGVVIESESENSALSGGRGNYIAIYSPTDDRTYVYFHMQRPSPLEAGDAVGAGDRVGAIGCTGSCWGEHLHFEVRLGRGSEAKPIDPLPLLRRWPQAPAAG